MLGVLAYLLLSWGFSSLELLRDGTQVQLALPDLATVLDTALVEGQTLTLDAELEPLASVVLVLNQAAAMGPEVQAAAVATLQGFISAAGDDIMVIDENGETRSLKDWLSQVRDIHFTLER